MYIPLIRSLLFSSLFNAESFRPTATVSGYKRSSDFVQIQSSYYLPSSVSSSCHRFMKSSRRLLQSSSTQLNVISSVSEQSNVSIVESSYVEDELIFTPVLDFKRSNTVDMIERLDDAIMGGISTSSVQSSSDKNYARWTGVCRTDGGGFCGFRTNPFQEPLMVSDKIEGFYVKCRLASDNEPDRRVWKMTTRVKPDRGEQLYQAQFELHSKKFSADSINGSDEDSSSWSTALVPFQTFRLVRGPRAIPDGPPLNTTSGLYQIGMTMSKFLLGFNTTQLDNFRDGYFDVHIREIGLYTTIQNNSNSQMDTIQYNDIRSPKVLTKTETKRKRPLVLKVLLFVSKLFFSEESNRRKSAMKVLTKQRKLSKLQAITYGIRRRAKCYGYWNAIVHSSSIAAIDIIRFVLVTILRISVFYPLNLINKFWKILFGNTKNNNDNRERE